MDIDQRKCENKAEGGGGTKIANTRKGLSSAACFSRARSKQGQETKFELGLFKDSKAIIIECQVMVGGIRNWV